MTEFAIDPSVTAGPIAGSCKYCLQSAQRRQGVLMSIAGGSDLGLFATTLSRVDQNVGASQRATKAFANGRTHRTR